MRSWLGILTGLVALFGVSASFAQSCGQYVVKPGDSLSVISANQLGSGVHWGRIYYTNQQVIGSDPNVIEPGMRLSLPCTGGEPRVGDQDRTVQQPTPPQGTTTTGDVAGFFPPSPNNDGGQTAPRPSGTSVVGGRYQVELLTGDDYAPFTDLNLPDDGMATAIVKAAFDTVPEVDASIYFQSPWGSHISKMLKTHKFDMGFPWFQPDCRRFRHLLTGDDAERCNFLFSREPIFDVVIPFYARVGRQVRLESDADLRGLRICRPVGYFTFDLAGRGLTPGENYELVTPRTPKNCFEMLSTGQVDLVSINDFTGDRVLAANPRLAESVTKRPELSATDALKLMVHRTHPQGRVLMELFNKGHDRIIQSGRKAEIISEHLDRYYNELEELFQG